MTIAKLSEAPGGLVISEKINEIIDKLNEMEENK